MTALSTAHPALTPAHATTPPPVRALAAELDRLLHQGDLRVVLQPVVDLRTRTTVALATCVQGPPGSPLSDPHELRAVAAAAGRLADLDRACRRAALTRADDLRPPWTLFLTTDLDSVDLGTTGSGGTDLVRSPGAGPTVVVDLGTHALGTGPAQLLRLADRARARGWGVALAGVGDDPLTAALLPLVRPDVVTLDLRRLAALPPAELAGVLDAVSALGERDGAVVLARGVDTEAQLGTALTVGATLGLGTLLGAATGPGEPAPPPPGTAPVVVPRPRAQRAGTPFDLVAAHRPARPSDAATITEAAHHLERRAARTGDPCLVVTTRPVGDDVGPAPGVHRVEVSEDDPLRGEHVVAVLGPHLSGVIVGRRVQTPTGATTDLELVVSHDPALVADVVSSLLDRGVPVDPVTPVPEVLAPAPPTAAPRPARTPVADPPDPAADPRLEALLAEAIDADRRVGTTATGLLLIGVQDSSATSAPATAVPTTTPPPAAPGSPEAVVRRLQTGVRSHDRWIALADDLHAVLLTGLPRAGAEAVVDRVADALLHALESSPLTDPDTGARVSIGASLSPTRAATVADAVAQARSALSAARAAGGHCARIRPV